jgi:hypothetical protein
VCEVYARGASALVCAKLVRLLRLVPSEMLAVALERSIACDELC